MDEKITILIVGAGELGSAIAGLLKKNSGLEVEMWDRAEEKRSVEGELEEVVKGRQVILLCIPSFAVREVALKIGGRVDDGAVVVNLAKGLENKSLSTMNQVLDEVLGVERALMLSGPMLAEELVKGLPGAACVAGNKEDYQILERVFVGSRINLEYSEDRVGVAWAGVLKNIYAFGLGVVDEMSWGSNVRGWYIQQAVGEMGDIIEMKGGDSKTARGLAGLGDLVATGMSEYSSNFEAGQKMVQGGQVEKLAEGVKSLQCIEDLLGSVLNEEWQLLQSLIDLVEGDAKPEELIDRIFGG